MVLLFSFSNTQFFVLKNFIHLPHLKIKRICFICTIISYDYCTYTHYTSSHVSHRFSILLSLCFFTNFTNIADSKCFNFIKRNPNNFYFIYMNVIQCMSNQSESKLPYLQDQWFSRIIFFYLLSWLT